MASSNSTVVAPCPPELLGIATQLEQLRPAARSAAITAMSAVITAMILSPINEGLPPLTAEQQAVIDYLREHGVTSAADLSQHVGYAENTIKRWCAPDGPLRAHGVTPTTRGYAAPSS